jgi:thermosome
MAYLVGGNQQFLVLKEGTERTTKKDAFSNNVAAAMAIAEAVKSTLGPKGLDKLMVDSLGDITITNDGATILKQIDVQHPTAKIMVEVAKTQDNEVGDGTTTSVILAGNILSQVADLIQTGVHPSIVASGVNKALRRALQIVDEVAYLVEDSDRELMRKVVSTSMNSKMIGLGKDRLSELVLDAVLTLKEDGLKNINRHIKNIKIVKKEGGSALTDTTLVKGIVLDKEILHSQMPREVRDAKIALVGYPLEFKKGTWDAKISISSPDQMESFLDEEESIVNTKIQRLADAGVNVVFSSKTIDDVGISALNRAGIMAVKGLNKSDMDLIASAIGGSVLNSIEEASDKDFGTADWVHESTIGDHKYIYIEGCKDPKALTMVIRGEGGKGLDEVERGIHDALCIAATLVENPYVVGCGGAIEIEVSKQLLEFAKTFSGREQLVIERFATALESIPKTLVDNAGLDAISIIGEIRSMHKTPDDVFYGYNLFTNQVEDMKASGVLEPAKLVKTAIQTAAEAATMIIRIDDVIKGSKGGHGGRTPPPMD